MSAQDYLTHIGKIISIIEETQKERIEEAAEVFARSIQAGGRVYLFGSGHSVIPVLDIFPRYGSFVGFYPIYSKSPDYPPVRRAGAACRHLTAA